jgi:hypothetical protein
MNPESDTPDSWTSEYTGKCDLCGQPKPIEDVRAGVAFGWRVGYVCNDCGHPAAVLPMNWFNPTTQPQ